MEPSSSSSSTDVPRITSKISTLANEVEEGSSSCTYRVLALYKFVHPFMEEQQLQPLQSEIETLCRKYSTRGTLLIAREGINGTICYPFDHDDDEEEEVVENATTNEKNNEEDPILQYFLSKFDKPRTRIAKIDRPIFARLKIKIKTEIVTMRQQQQQQQQHQEGGEDCSKTASSSSSSCCLGNPENVGQYVKAAEWNDLINDPNCLVIDTRNEYEINVGTFRNAINPHTQNFVEFPNWMEQNIIVNKQQQQTPKKIAMFCTGGIRCEKATNAVLKLVPSGIPIYHLEGGILAYLDEISKSDSLFDGECYVFDQRIAVTYGNKPSTKYQNSCHACRHPLSKKDMEHSQYVEGISCHYCYGQLSGRQLERFVQRQRQIELARQKGIQHIHDPKELTTTSTNNATTSATTTAKKQRSK